VHANARGKATQIGDHPTQTTGQATNIRCHIHRPPQGRGRDIIIILLLPQRTTSLSASPKRGWKCSCTVMPTVASIATRPCFSSASRLIKQQEPNQEPNQATLET
jgi:hypothetical protein